MCIFKQIRQWCLDSVNRAKPDPLHVFITGGAGAGKSHLIKAIQYEAMRLLSRGCRAPDYICVPLTAPTGIAAHNLNAATIHNAFSIGKEVLLPYTTLGEDWGGSRKIFMRWQEGGKNFWGVATYGRRVYILNLITVITVWWEMHTLHKGMGCYLQTHTDKLSHAINVLHLRFYVKQFILGISDHTMWSQLIGDTVDGP